MKMSKAFRGWFAVICFLVSLPAAVYAQESEPTVRFDCNDMGVEARRLIAQLNEERNALKEKQKIMDEREEKLKILKSEVDKKIKQLTELRKELDELMVKKNEVEMKKVKKLSKIYQKRNPASAAETLASMEKDLAVSILSMMRDKYAGKILDEMDPKTAVSYSSAMGGPRGVD